MKVLVTGSNGFVGRALCEELLRRGFSVVAGVRSGGRLPFNAEVVVVGDVDAATNWHPALRDCDVVVHLAAHVHVARANAAEDAKFHTVNTLGTLQLARQAAALGVKRLVYLSSVKVNGEASAPGSPFRESDTPHPVDAYGFSKCEGENALRQLAQTTGMEVVIVRPPLVYGPGVKANFATLMKAVMRKWPLPLGAIHNMRSLVALDNLTDFIATCVHHPAAANQTFFVSDGQDVSTADLVRGMARAAGMNARLLPVPMGVLRFVGSCLGRGDDMQRLCGSLQVDISKARRVLGWAPPLSLQEGLRRAVVKAGFQ